MKKITLMVLCCFIMTAMSAEQKPALRKVKDVVVYKDTNWFSAFPSVVKNGKKDIMVAFRRAPERRLYGEPKTTHNDPNSYLVAVHSRDGGETWTKNPELIYAHPRGGSQDPCMLKLKNGTILCAGYWWASVKSSLAIHRISKAKKNVFGGGYLLRSTDNGKTWSEPILPPALDDNEYHGIDGKPYPIYNRGAMCEARDGRILWVVPRHKAGEPSILYLMVSKDKGMTWEKSGVVARDEKIGFNEASVYETPSGDIVVFIRTTHKHRGYISRSKDGGKTFTWEPLGFAGHPHHALRLPDKRVLLTYGHRPAPRCIKARILNPECTDFATAEEFVIYDGPTKSGDIGYPWSVMIDRKHVLTVYYYNHNNGTRFIGGTILEIN